MMNLKNKNKFYRNRSIKTTKLKEIQPGHKLPWPKEELSPGINSGLGKNLLPSIEKDPGRNNSKTIWNKEVECNQPIRH